MFNSYLEMTPENKHIMFANAVIEHLKFVVISLDTILGGFQQQCDKSRFYEDKYAFYFYHLQNALVSCGNINNVFMDRQNPNSAAYVRANLLREKFDVNLGDYTCLFNKNFRNTSEHFDERYDSYYDSMPGFGDYNIISSDTPLALKNEILDSSSLRTLDLTEKKYKTYDRNGSRITLDLQKLRSEAYELLYKISSHELVANSVLTNIPTEMIEEKLTPIN